MARPRTFDTTLVVDAAMQRFWRDGYAGTSPQDLVDATGLSRGSLYNAFGSKRELFLRALEHYERVETTRLHAVLGGAGPAPDRLRDAVELVVRAAHEDDDGRGCLVTNTAIEATAEDPELRARVAAVLDAQRAAFARVVAEGRDAGELAADVDPDAAAELLLSVIGGVRVTARARGHGSGPPASAPSPSAVAELAVRALRAPAGVGA